MDVPDNVPCLTELVDHQANLGRTCHWSAKSRCKEQPSYCTRRIGAKDVNERDSLLEKLRPLLPAKTDAKYLLRPTLPDTVSEIHSKLQEISKRLLCKAKHREEIAEAIFQKWSNELDDLEKVINIRKELKIDDDDDDGDGAPRCHGINSRRRRCRSKISRKNRDIADVIIGAMEKDQSSSTITPENLLKLARLLLCQGYHQDQAAGKSQQWFIIIEKLFPQANTAQQRPSTPPFTRASTLDSVTTQYTARSTSPSEQSTGYSTPATSPPSPRLDVSDETSPISPLYLKGRTTTSHIADEETPRLTQIRVTRNKTTEVLLPVLPKFKPFSPKSDKMVLNGLYKLLVRAFGILDEAPGYVYGFKRDKEICIKVGYTNNIKGRKGEWKNQCHQKITVLFEKPTPHAHKIEGLVHATLYHARRHENLVGGKCNGGRGCATRHREWLEVTEERLLEVVDAWICWIRTNPYRKGKLRSKWKKYIDNLRQTQSELLPEPWRQWIDITFLGEIITAEAKDEVEEDKDAVSLNIKLKTENKWDQDEETPDFQKPGRRHRLRIKDEPDDDIPSFAELDKKYRQDLKKSEDENPVVLRDVPRYLEDPFL